MDNLGEWCLLFCEYARNVKRVLMMNVVGRETAGALISSSCTHGVTMISHTPFFSHPNIRKAGNFLSCPATKASDGCDAMDAIDQFYGPCSQSGNNLHHAGLTLTS